MKKRIFALALAVVLLLSMSMVVYAAPGDPVTINVEANGSVQPSYSIVYTQNTVVMEKDDSLSVGSSSTDTWVGTYHVGIIVTQGSYESNEYVYAIPDATFSMAPVGGGTSVTANTNQPVTKWRENPGSASDSTTFIRGITPSTDGSISISTDVMKEGTVSVELPKDASVKYTGSFQISYGKATDL